MTVTREELESEFKNFLQKATSTPSVAVMTVLLAGATVLLFIVINRGVMISLRLVAFIVSAYIVVGIVTVAARIHYFRGLEPEARLMNAAMGRARSMWDDLRARLDAMKK